CESVVYSFIVEWYKDESGLIEQFKLNFYPDDNSVEMYDLKHHRLFLRKLKQADLKVSDLYIGSSVNILSRHLRIVQFADEFTSNALSGNSERCVCIISPLGTCSAGKYIGQFEDNGFKIVNLKLLYLDSTDVRTYFSNSLECKYLDKLASILTDGGTIAVELMRRNANSVLKEMIYGKSVDNYDLFANTDVFVLAQTPEAAAVQAHLLFSTTLNQKNRNTTNIQDSTCAVVKPHAVRSGQLGAIWETIQSNGFCVVGAQVYRLSKVDASEFLEVYKGVLAEYPELINEMTSGPCVALQIAQVDSDQDKVRQSGESTSVQLRFREIVGPMDPDIARYLKPNTIRAKFGVNLVKNAIHCTDLPDDVPMEIDFFFRILKT
ncbi:unnamed protein product, partial [Mesocestoides corti]